MGGKDRSDRHTRTLAPDEIARLKEESARHDAATVESEDDVAFVHDAPPAPASTPAPTRPLHTMPRAKSGPTPMTTRALTPAAGTRRAPTPATATPTLGANADAMSTEPISWDDLAIPEEPEAPAEDHLVSEARTTTVQDPLTAALLAEVTREARTLEFDPAELARTLANADAMPDKPADLPHPKLKRRDG